MTHRWELSTEGASFEVNVGKMSTSSSIGGTSGSVARKIALFQCQVEGDLVSSSGTLKLRRKEVIKRKKPPTSTSFDSDTQSSCAASTFSSPASSDSCYGGSSIEEGQGHGPLSNLSSNYRRDVGTQNSRHLKDCYQSFTLPSRPGRRPCFRLVEFSDFGSDLEVSTDCDAFYEELDSPTTATASKPFRPRHSPSSQRTREICKCHTHFKSSIQ